MSEGNSESGSSSWLGKYFLLAVGAAGAGYAAYKQFCPSAKSSPEYESVTCPMTGRTYKQPKLPEIQPTRQMSSAESGEVSSPTATFGQRSPSTYKSKNVKPKRGQEPVQYHSYLELDSVLHAQKPKSWVEGGTYAHDEHLFIITHQASELWMKQILHDVGAVIDCMSNYRIEENEMGKILERLSRSNRVLRLLVDHLKVQDTMTPLSFLEFRDYLFPASGFQSMQFRMLEVKLGLRRKSRLSYAGTQFDCSLTPEQSDTIQEMEKESSLFDLVDKWLARIPVLETADFDFWAEYQRSVKQLLQEEKDGVDRQLAEGVISEQIYENRMKDLQGQLAFFDRFFDETLYNEYRAKGEYRMSHKACQATLMINFYQEEPLFQLPHQFLTLLIEIDQLLSAWRTTHAGMVHKMLGLKMGTGGSSGYQYLLGTVRHHRIFNELCDMASLMVPRSYLPPLPASVSRFTSFNPMQ